MKKMRFFKALTILLLTAGIAVDYFSGYYLNYIYFYALIAVLFS